KHRLPEDSAWSAIRFCRARPACVSAPREGDALLRPIPRLVHLDTECLDCHIWQGQIELFAADHRKALQIYGSEFFPGLRWLESQARKEGLGNKTKTSQCVHARAMSPAPWPPATSHPYACELRVAPDFHHIHLPG